MRFEYFIAWRYLRSRRRHSLTAFLAWIATLAVTLSIAALIFALALMNGFRAEIRDKLLSGTAHLNLLKADGGEIENYAELTQRIAQTPGVIAAAATTYTPALIALGERNEQAILKAVDLTAPPAANEVFTTTIEGDPRQLQSAPHSNDDEPQGLVMGRELARALHNNLLDACVAGAFLGLVSIIVLVSLREWLLLLARKKVAELRETPPVWLPDYAVAEAKPLNFLSLLALGLALVKELSGEAHLDRAQKQACECNAAHAEEPGGRGGCAQRPGAGPLRRPGPGHPAGDGRGDEGSAGQRQCSSEEERIRGLSRRAARLPRRLQAQLPQGRGRRRLEALPGLAQGQRRGLTLRPIRRGA